MKIFKIAILVLLATVAGSVQSRATPFLDLYGGTASFGDVKTTQTGVGDNNNTKILNSYIFGLRAGSITQGDLLSFAIAFDNSFYRVNAARSEKTNNTALDTTYTDDMQGGLVWQPGVQVIAGVPLRHVRLYAGAGLIMPIVMYNYTAYDPTTDNAPYSTSGMSATLGGQFLFGGRWLITKKLNLFVEDRVQKIFSPLAIKNSYGDTNNMVFHDETFTFQDLNSNQIVFGMGYAWGN
jgi:hypothetical protein